MATMGEFNIESADILRLILAHLTECGLSNACKILRQESGVGMAGLPRAVHSNLKAWAERGEWGLCLEALVTLDACKMKTRVMAFVHEMAILEMAEEGHLRLAYATLRGVQDILDLSPTDDILDTTGDTNPKSDEYSLSRKRDLEQKLAALVSLRRLQADSPSGEKGNAALPLNFYGSNKSKQARRNEIGQQLMETIPVAPSSRLTSLLQQAFKWQAYTGQLPRVRNLWEDDEAIDNIQGEDDHNKRPRKRKRKVFDLVLGEASADSVAVGEIPSEDAVPLDPIPSKPWTTLKFGKKATAEAACFAPDEKSNSNPTATSFSLVTGSSDGLVEIYDAHNKYASLRMDLPYQEKDELLGHDDGCSVLAITASNDGAMLATGDSAGQVKVWRVSSGKCLRKFAAHENFAISCLAFSPDGSHVLSGSQDSNCREFGLRTTRMLKEFQGHASYIHTCQYVIKKGGQKLSVLSSSGDGTVRLWDAKTSEVLRVLRPVSLGESLSNAGSSLVVDNRSDLTSGAGASPAVHSVLQLHSPQDCFVIVPRGLRAFLVNHEGTVLRTFEDDRAKSVFVAAATSPSNHWLYCVTEEGFCCVFDMVSGKLEATLRNFADETTCKSKEGTRTAEISAVIHHPQKGVLAAFSNDKGQKKGQLVLWK